MKRVILSVLLMAGTAYAQRSAEHLLADPSSLADARNIPLLRASYSTAFHGTPGESGFNLHSYLEYFDGRYWLAWSSSKVNEEDPDQHIMYATSRDGHVWSVAQILAPDPDGASGPQRWITRGLFVEGGHLFALGALVASADYKNQGKAVVWRDLQLVRFVWTGKEWKRDSVFAENCMNNFPPLRYEGRYVMPCRDNMMALKIDVGEPGKWKSIAINAEPPFNKMDEPTLYRASDDTLQLIIRDGARSHYLLRAISTDNGSTWTAPVRTDYPDATSKNFASRLSNGRFILINNPNQTARDPLAISVSKDGWVFSNPRALRASSQMSNPSAKWSFQYPHAIEHDGSLWVAYSVNKRDIEVCEIKLSELHP